MARSILIVDDDARIRTSLSEALADSSTQIHTAGSAEHALSVLSEVRPGIVVTDVRMPGMDGLELLRLLRERAPNIAVILMTAFDDLATVVQAMKEGAVDFLVKPVDLNQLQKIIGKVWEDRGVRSATDTQPEDRTGDPLDRLIGHDPKMIQIFKLIGQVADSRTNVIIRGESGTGKELIAQAIHESSPHASEPFVPVNCTALPSTLLESELFGHMRGSFTGAAGDRRGRFALAGIRVDLQRVQAGLDRDSPLREPHERALREIARLNETVASTLKRTRADAPHGGGRVIDVREPIRAAADAAAPAFEEARGTLALNLPDSAVAVSGDQAGLEQLFLNLIQNAAHALRPGGEATVRVVVQADAITVTVSDDGVGIPEDLQERVFDPLFSTRPEGTGLGLTLARRIAEAHGGGIELESDPGAGTRVRVRLPKA